MNIFWYNANARMIYDYAWLSFLVGIIIMIIFGIVHLKNKKILKEDLTLEEEEKKNKIKKLNKTYIVLWVAVAIISGICFAGIRITMRSVFSCSTNYYSPVEVTMSDGKNTIMYYYKPIIYLYPEEETEVNVKLNNPEKLTCTYPKYKASWKVTAKPNGDLIDLSTGRNLYALYWEGINTTKSNEKEGFVVKGEDTISFLEEKLEILGLTEREANEFIMYWLPQMEPSEYNFIRFETIEEINENMPLEISPKPDSFIRVMMEWKPLTEEKEIEEQELVTPVREGFTLVEWGGSRIG